MIRIGIDLGGTKIEGIALGAGGEELGRLRIATPRGDYDATLQAIASIVGSLERDGGRGSVGLGIPGTPSPLCRPRRSSSPSGCAFPTTP